MELQKFKNKYIIIIIVVLLLILILEYVYGNNYSSISLLTDNWINTVTIDKNPQKIYDLFSSDGILLGTVSRITRTGIDIKKYFDYFAKLPGLKVIRKKYDIKKITNNVFMNITYITWEWEGQEPLTANMVFIFKGNKIYYLNSSTLPEVNESLLKISGKK